MEKFTFDTGLRHKARTGCGCGFNKIIYASFFEKRTNFTFPNHEKFKLFVFVCIFKHYDNRNISEEKKGAVTIFSCSAVKQTFRSDFLCC